MTSLIRIMASRLPLDEVIFAGRNRRLAPDFAGDGRPTAEVENIRQALRPLKRPYGRTPSRDCGPFAFKVVCQAMIESGRSRKLIHKDVHRIRVLFRWTAGKELSPGDALASLDPVAALQEGRGEAAPVAASIVGATLPHHSPQVVGMVPLRLLTAACPGEASSIRPRDVDRSYSESWIHRPGSHETEHHGRADDRPRPQGHQCPVAVVPARSGL